MKYAIAQTSGKQFVFQPSYWYDVDLIQPAELGDFLFLGKVLLLKRQQSLQVGKPFLTKSSLPCQIIQQVKGPKIVVLKTKPKKKYTRVRGHRQPYTRVAIPFC
jgi:large subunit ribosomal protein L21